MRNLNNCLLIVAICFFITPLLSAQQSAGKITGRITTKDGKAVEGVMVFVKDTKHQASSDKAGQYLLTGLAAGSYTLATSMTGLQPQIRKLILHREETVVLDLSLAENEQQLVEVTVTARKTPNERVTTAGKSGIQPKDLPQSITIIDREVLEKQQVQLLSDVLKNVNGVYVMGTSGGTQEEIAARGYAFSSSNTFKNGVRYNNGILPEMSSLERVEILKGSNAILYGNVAAGGILNLVTRKPIFEKGGGMSFRMGSNDFYKTSIDLHGAINNSDAVAYRVNTSYEKSNSFRDQVHAERFYINPAFIFKWSERTTVLLESDYVTDDRTSDYGTGAVNYTIAAIPRNRFLGAAWSYNKAAQKSLTLTTTHKLGSAWELKNVTSFSNYTADLFGTTRPNASNNFIRSDGRWIRGLQRTETDESYYLTQFDLTGRFTTTKLTHQLLAGADAEKYQTRTTAYNPIAAYDTINIYDETKYRQRKDIPDLSRNTLSTAPIKRVGIYVQDLVSVNAKLKLLAGIRYTYQQTGSQLYYFQKDSSTAAARNDHAYTPRVGLVYQPCKSISLFVSYANSFAINTAIDTAGNPLPPSYLDQYEAGIKTDLFHRFLSANLTVYRIVNSNLAQSLFPVNSRYPTAQELAGEVTSKGIEVDVATRAYQGVSLLAGYSFNDTRYTRSNTYLVGSKLRYNPQHTANASMFYSCSDKSRLSGLTMGITAAYTGERVAGRSTRLTIANDTYRLMTVPAFTQVDLSLGYTRRQLSFRLKASNVFDVLSYHVHDDNSVNPVAPRQFSASIGCKL
ncbi:MAG: fhuA [Sediminibacterium sp.]|nr:fhuA [Sediminibacterium sp.]